ncbi:Peptidoglycan/LPS O-acetylase OafA/YrhL, contains acyltransferase and SGNH-hydrolase domains [Marinobacter sp. es.042]|uniref:acyltransferase family protein n=1 Tax=Marinobacter sp. es.042 TaxID=1761794 RepID=UPI000B51307B|nr:acyltransferase [Marinobacter sp. es.042]SNB55508.1 Peptidoglycan/LPS O-acetylase OafA/YrhL, contains acyltransferase and SGNH-hydrolase domains [Marinobacter sp. es.042]
MHARKPELTALTSLRGIAAIFVVWHHFMFVAMPDVAAITPTRLFEKSYLWVDLFFMLSGFVLAYIYHDTFRIRITGPQYRDFIQSRFARIYPLHLFMLLLFVGFEGLQWFLSYFDASGMENLAAPFTGKQSVETLVTNLLLVQTLHWATYWNEPAWSISAEWIMYFFLPFLLQPLLRLQKQTYFFVAALALIPLVAIESYFGDLGLYYAGWPMLVRCLCEATLGIIAFRLYQMGSIARLASSKHLLPVFILNLVILAVPGPGVISVVSFFWLVLCASRLPKESHHVFNHPLLLYFGKISYSIYLVHWLLIDLLKEGTQFFTGTPAHQDLPLFAQFAVITMMLVVVIGLSAMTYRFVEEPMRKLLKPRVLRPSLGDQTISRIKG